MKKKINDIIHNVVPPAITPLGKAVGKKRPMQVVLEATPQAELHRLVRMHKRWVSTSKAWKQSVSDFTTKDGKLVLCTIPDTIKEDLQGAVKDLDTEAASLTRAMATQLKHFPIFVEFVNKVFGMRGPVVASYLVTMIKIDRCVKPSQLWRYCGNANGPDGKRERRDKGPKYAPDGTLTGATGTYNAELKMRIWQGMTAMRKCSAKKSEDAPHGTTNKYLDRWRNAAYSRRTMGRAKGADHAGRRKATDLFLEDLYILWRTLAGLPVWPDLYSVRRGFHHGGKPCVNEGRVLTLEEAWDVIGDVSIRPMTEAEAGGWDKSAGQEDEEDEGQAAERQRMRQQPNERGSCNV